MFESWNWSNYCDKCGCYATIDCMDDNNVVFGALCPDCYEGIDVLGPMINIHPNVGERVLAYAYFGIIVKPVKPPDFESVMIGLTI
jgi:hypothetical protein